MFGVLCVCLGNICRSPLAEGVIADQVRARNLTDCVFVDSCGTAGYHTGEQPHSGGMRCAKGHGIDISGHHARQLQVSDYEKFDLILAMDRSNLDDIQDGRPRGKSRAKIALLNDYLPKDYPLSEVPDCWYARDQGKCFEEVFQMILKASEPILAEATSQK